MMLKNQTISEKIFYMFCNLMPGLYVLTIALPFWFVIANSFITDFEYSQRGMMIFLPRVPILTAYREMLSGPNFNMLSR